MSSKPKNDRLVWLDLEMTGLNPKVCTILEIGAVITDGELNVVAEGPAIAIHHSEKVLKGMESWSRHHHKKSGLTEACRLSRTSLKRAEDEVLAFVKAHCTANTAPLCGNTIWQDRRFLVKYMPRLESYLHYRVIDVSSVKELVGRWYADGFKMPRMKNQTHRVAEDIRESIEELRFYREKVFVPA
ncbi:MAG TPA: oligoribonuclease [Candidatus Eisenbacteria bacterium]|nr:oligoribonuclease [Candidatus Eisenbacteria bacterium]